MLRLYKKLACYYFKMDPVATASYVYAYREMRDEEEDFKNGSKFEMSKSHRLRFEKKQSISGADAHGSDIEKGYPRLRMPFEERLIHE